MKTYGRRNDSHAFAKYDLSAVLEAQRAKLGKTICEVAEDYLLNVNREEYLKHAVEKFHIAPLELHADRMSANPEEMMIPAEMFPPDFSVRSGKAYAKLVITYHLPFSGDPQLLEMSPNVFGTWTPAIWVQGQSVCFEYVDFRQQPEETKRHAEGIVHSLQQSARNVNNQLEGYNASLRSHAEQMCMISLIDGKRAGFGLDQ